MPSRINIRQVLHQVQTKLIYCQMLQKCSDRPILLEQGGHKPGKHGKPGKLREFGKLLKSQGKLREILFLQKNLENSRKT